MNTGDDWIDFRCTRERDERTARLVCRYRSSGERLAIEPGSLDEFLHERYVLFIKKDETIYSADVHHAPWDLHAADARIEENDMGGWLGLDLTQTQPIVRYVRASDVLAWSPEPVSEPVAQPSG